MYGKITMGALNNNDTQVKLLYDPNLIFKIFENQIEDVILIATTSNIPFIGVQIETENIIS